MWLSIGWWWLVLGCASQADAPAPAPEPEAPAAERPKPSPVADKRRRKLTERLRSVEVSGDDIGGDRSAWVRVPERVDGAMPVVLVFHGGKGNSGIDIAKHWTSAFDEPVLLVFPNGQLEEGEPGWTGVGRDEGDAAETDVRFVAALLDELHDRFSFDRDRVYAAGFSNGGFMTWQLYCGLGDRIAGAAVVAKPFLKKLRNRCATPTGPLMLVAGTDDPQATWEEKEHTMSVPDTVDLWRETLGCDEASRQVTTLPDTGDKTTVVRRTWGRCTKAAFAMYKIEGGGHYWPRPGEGGPPGLSHDLDATQEILAFFREHGGL